MSAVRIQPARRWDARGVARVLTACLDEARWLPRVRRARDERRLIGAMIARGEVRVAKRRGRIVGFVILDGAGEVQGLYVLPEAQGTGVAQAILAWSKAQQSRIGLWVHGAPNAPVDNAYALDGIVETDWLCAGFTVNWKITKRNTPVFFQKGDPVCMLTPYPLDLLEGLTPKQKLVTAEPELHDAFRAAADRRNQTLQRTAEKGEKHFELDYMHGRDEEGHKRQGHRTNVKLATFEDERLSSNGQS